MAGSRSSTWPMRHKPVSRPGSAPRGYADLAMCPLHVLFFLLPLIILYEAGSSLYLADDAQNTVETIRAHSIMLSFFQEFGVVGRFVPGIALVTVLVLWHMMNGDSWRVRPLVLLGMLGEAIAWTMPLLVLIVLVQVAAHSAVAVAAQTTPPLPAGIAAMSDQALITISIGAGLYEELLFRMLGIALLHIVFVDLARMSDKWGTGLAILISAIAFALYHDVRGPTGELLATKAISLLFAGGYFGLLYIFRGFGIVVGVHALYDIAVLVGLPKLG